MATFAQIVNGKYYNVITGSSLNEALARCFAPGYDGGYPGVSWQQVPDNITSELVVVPPKYVVYLWNDFNKYIIGLLNPDGRAKLQDILEKCQGKTGTTVAARNVRNFYTWYVGSVTFEREETREMLQAVIDADNTIINTTQRDAVMNNWKTL